MTSKEQPSNSSPGTGKPGQGPDRLAAESEQESTAIDSIWFARLARHPQPQGRLLCFPYAGGNPSAFRGWPQGLAQVSPNLGASLDVLALNLPGRLGRFREPPMVSMAALLAEIRPLMEALLTLPTVFFGHSMGAVIAYELARQLSPAASSQLKGLILSGRAAPGAQPKGRALHALPRDAFYQELEDMNGTPREILANPALMAMLEPTLRADLQLIEMHPGNERIALDQPILAVTGSQDPLATWEQMQGWRECTRQEFSEARVEGDHFFINQNQADLYRLIAPKISAWLT